uniref:Leptin n=1 Tax=Chanos chanos TaxID=29144 RepID=A0A7G7LN55_CHACN|nr:leptin A [Chanos chanos]
MVRALALFWSCAVTLAGLGVCWPLPPDTFRHYVKLQAEDIASKIQRHRDQQSHLSVNIEIVDKSLSLDRSIEGLGSIVETLNSFQKALESLPNSTNAQMSRDVGTLQSYLEQRMVALQCSQRKLTVEKNLETFLKNHRPFPVTLSHTLLDRLQKYLIKLTRNLDQLKIC